jgi:digeranylgeranylglycerophospholipid reductase
MLDREYDIVVVGAGPSGSWTARVAAEQGAAVLVVEKKRAIGTPLSCAEGVSKPVLEAIVAPKPSWIAAQVAGAVVTTPGGRSFRIQHPDAGYILERKIFDRDLAAMAVESGARLLTDVEVVDLLRENGSTKGVVVSHRGRKSAVRSKVVVGADGVNSRVARWAKIDEGLSPEDFHACAEYLLGDVEVELGYTEFIAGNEIAPGGYAWIFPKSRRTANVGLGISPHVSKKRPFEYLDLLVEKRFPGASRLETVSGTVPTSPIDRLVTDGVMLVGDAARVADPITGGGIANGLLSAMVAGRVAAECARRGDVTRRALSAYEKEWGKSHGRELRYRARAREIYLKLTDADFEKIFDFVRLYFGDKVISEFHPRQLIVPLIKSSPRFLSMARHLI